MRRLVGQDDQNSVDFISLAVVCIYIDLTSTTSNNLYAIVTHFPMDIAQYTCMYQTFILPYDIIKLIQGSVNLWICEP